MNQTLSIALNNQDAGCAKSDVATDEYLVTLRESLVNALDERELRDLCAKLSVDYDRLPGGGKVDKVTDLLVSLRHSGRIHALVRELAVLQRDVTPQAIANPPANDPTSPSTKEERREKRKAKGLSHRKRFLRAFFDGQSIAFEEDLCKSWEFVATKIVHRFLPRYVKRRITRLPEEFAVTDFVVDLESLESEESRSDTQAKLATQNGMPLIDRAFANYHSVCLWYREIRHGIQLLLTPFATLGMLRLLVILAYMGGAFLVFVGSAPDIDQSNPGLVYTFPESGEYYVEVKDTASVAHRYMFGAAQPSSDAVTPDFSQGDIWPLRHGDQVFSRLRQEQQHLYYVDGTIGETIVVELYCWYADVDLDFMLFDSAMNECNALSLSRMDLEDLSAYLGCTVTSPGRHYLRVQFSSPTLWLSSRYGFRIYKVLDYVEREPNDSFESSLEVPRGAFVLNTLGSQGRGYYHLTAQAGQRLEISAYNLSHSPLSSVTLYKPTENGPVVVGHSTRSLSPLVRGKHNLFETSYGRAIIISFLLRKLGFDKSPKEIVGEGTESWILLFPVYSVVIVFLGYALFLKYLSQRKYEESLAIRRIVKILWRLRDDDALRSEDKKSRIRLDINLASDSVQRIHKITIFPRFSAAPKEMEKRMTRIASQIRQMNVAVSTPGVGTLSFLRRRFTQWLDVFLKGEYGQFEFDSGFEMKLVPWYRQFLYTIQRHWKKIGVAVVFALTVIVLTQSIWQDYWIEIVASAWLMVRYIILVVAVNAVYDRWGAKGPTEKEESKWWHAVRLILFFFVPLFAFDVLLQTGIVESIIKLISSLKIF